MKLLLYCTKAKPYLYPHFNKLYFTKNKDFGNVKLNGKIVAECDFEVERIIYNYLGNSFYDFYGMQLHTKTLKESEILQRSKLDSNELRKYLLRTEDDYLSPLEVGYAIHIKNLHIFDEPRELEQLETFDYKAIKKAPQNMMKCMVLKNDEHYDEYILISIKPEWLCKILNGEKTIEVRKKVLKEMLN